MSRLRAAALLGVLTVAFYWKLTLSSQFTFVDSPDLSNMTLPWYQFQARAFHRGEFPLWDPHQWCGQTVVGQMQPGLAFPLNWPLFAAPLKDGGLNLAVLHWHYVFLHWLAALMMYACCRQLGRGPFASILAGCAFSFGGFVGMTTWPQVMNGAMWLPLIFLFYHRTGEAATGMAAAANAAGCGAAVGLALMAGHHQAPMLEILALTLVFLFHLLTRGDRWRRIGLFTVTGACAALVGALLLLPAWEYGSRAYRWVNLDAPVRLAQTLPYITQQRMGVRPLDLLGLSMPIDGGTTHPLLGLVPLSLALLGIAACWRVPAVRLHAGIAVGGLAYGLGFYSVFQGVLYAVVPFLNKSRSPSYAELIVQFGLIVVAAHGADVLFEAGVWQRRLVRVLLGAGALYLAGQVLLAGANPGSQRAEALILGAVVAWLLAAVVHAASGGHFGLRAAKFAVLALALVELSASALTVMLPRRNPETPTHLERLAGNRGIVEFLRAERARTGPFRVGVDEQEIPYNLGDWDEIETSGGYLATVSADLFDFVSRDWTRSALMLNQVFEIRRQPARPQQQEVFAEPSGLKVFRNPDALPRAWMVRRVARVEDRSQADALFASEDFDPRREVFLLGGGPSPPAFPPCEQATDVEWVAQRLHRTALRVRGACGGMLVLADPIFPGWFARVGGQPAEIYAVFGALRGVIVPPGDHLVEFVYRPLSVYLGAALSALGVVGCLLLAVAARRSTRRSRKAG